MLPVTARQLTINADPQTLRSPLHEVVVLALIVHPNAIDVVPIEVPPEDIRVRLEQ